MTKRGADAERGSGVSGEASSKSRGDLLRQLEEGGWAVSLQDQLADMSGRRANPATDVEFEETVALARAVIARGLALRDELERVSRQFPRTGGTLQAGEDAVQRLRSVTSPDGIADIDRALNALRKEADQRIQRAKDEVDRLERTLEVAGAPTDLTDEEPLGTKLRRLRSLECYQSSERISRGVSRIDAVSEAHLTRQSQGPNRLWRSQGPPSLRHMLGRVEDLRAARRSQDKQVGD